MQDTHSQEPMIKKSICLDGHHLNLADFVALVERHAGVEVHVSPEAWERIERSARAVRQMVDDEKIVYGVTTGFGSLRDVAIPSSQVAELQRNLIESHAIGVGAPVSPIIVRSMLALRINAIARGFSGVRPEVVRAMLEALRADALPVVPCQGTVGASGDLAPLSHMVLGLMGLGEMRDPKTGKEMPAAEVLETLGLKPIALGPKEGLALNNGTQFMTAHMAYASYYATRLYKQATVVAALTVEALRGTNRAYDARAHDLAKPHPGQVETAQQLRWLLGTEGSHHHHQNQPHDAVPVLTTEPATHGRSAIYEKYGSKHLQEAYSLRCIPQVHGPVVENVEKVAATVLVEMNSANDNPLIFAIGDEQAEAVSAGNFHGQYVADAADNLSRVLSTLTNASERRIERMVNGQLNGLGSSFLTKKGDVGLNSGFMIWQYMAAGIAAENRVHAAPGSVHSIPTCENQEDLVSMGGYPARRALVVVENAYRVLAAELVIACQALELTPDAQTTAPLRRVYDLVRSSGIKPVWSDSYIKPYVDVAFGLLWRGAILGSAYHARP